MKLPRWVLEWKRKRIERDLRDKHPLEVIRYLNNRLGSFTQDDYYNLVIYEMGISDKEIDKYFILSLTILYCHTWLLSLEDSEIRSLLTLMKLSR
jgi:hypothetical protein